MTNVFIDTNILVSSLDHRDPAKRARAKNILANLKARRLTPIISTQVLQEFCNILTRKLLVSPHNAHAELVALSGVLTIQITPALILAAADLHAQASISFWDALIVAAAQSAGWDQIWTADLQSGQFFGTTQIMNPFLLP